jgi:hypothetical protein
MIKNEQHHRPSLVLRLLSVLKDSLLSATVDIDWQNYDLLPYMFPFGKRCNSMKHKSKIIQEFVGGERAQDFPPYIFSRKLY